MGSLLAVRAVRVAVVLLWMGVVGAVGRADEPPDDAEEIWQPDATEPDEDYERLFPHYRKLRTPVHLSTPFLSFQGLADLTEVLTGLSIELDRLGLDELRLHPEEKFRDAIVLGQGRVPLNTYLHHGLLRIGARLVVKPEELLITCPERAERYLHVEVYPVADLFLSDHATSPELLADPVFDAERAAEARIRANLNRPVSLTAVETPLADVLFDIAAQANVPLVIDDRALAEVAIDRRVPVTVQCRDLAAEKAFERTLRSLHFQAHCLSTVVFVSTRERLMEPHATVRLHSVQGLVYECREPWAPCQPIRPRREVDPGRGGFFNVEMPDEPRPEGRREATGGGEHSLSEESRCAHTAPGCATRKSPRPAQPEPALPDPGTHPPQPGQECDTLAEEPQYHPDFDSIIGTITTMVAPDTWKEMRGFGLIHANPHSLDLVVFQAPDVHKEIEQLLNGLRRLPPVVDGHPAMRPVELPHVEHLTWRELEGLCELLTRCVAPDSWDSAGGHGTMHFDVPRGALIVSHTRDVHQQLRHVLTQLRRRRQEQRQHDNAEPGTTPQQGD